MSATILITGGTGLVGAALTRHLLDKGFRVIVLTRDAARKTSTEATLSYAGWDVKAQTIDREAVEKADYIIHLAGAGVADKRWTEKRKQEIVDSRVQGSALLVKALREIPNKVRAVISASAIGWYGADPVPVKDAGFTETDPADTAFLGDTCRQWEAAVDGVTAMGNRLVKLRIGIVLSTEGGALPEFKKPLRFGVAAILGSGRQVISWIHIGDLCRMIVYAMEDEKMQGVYNAVAPQPVTNRALTLALAKQVKGKFFIPVNVPAFVLKIMMGEMSVEVLKSATVSSAKISEAGFRFLYPSVDAALSSLLAEH
jgi:uncharacterized protein